MYSLTASPRVQNVTLTSTNQPIPQNGTTYTLGVNQFEAGGGDGAATLAGIASSTSFKIEADALLNYIVSQGTVVPATNGRITQIP